MTSLSCLSITACRASLDVLERFAYSRDDLARRLPILRSGSHADAVAVLSTCQRTEVYATWPGSPDHIALVTALAADRGVSRSALRPVARTYSGEAAARHLLRVASGLESFVLGEAEIAGQVRAAAEISRAAGTADAELGRLMDAAISASRKRQRQTSIQAAARSIAGVAVEAVARRGTLAGKRLLVVGAGEVASVVVARAAELQADVTVCNRTRRHAHQFAAAGAAVVDLADLAECLAATDIAVLATAAPHPLVDARILRSARAPGTGPLTLLDLSMPRNVDPEVRALAWVRLIDLDDLRAAGTGDADDLAGDLAAAEEIIETELRRYQRWLSGRSSAAALRRMRTGAEDIARDELARIAGELPADVRASLERVLLRTVHRLVHKPTLELRAAAEANDIQLVQVLAGLFDAAPPPPPAGPVAAGAGLAARYLDAAARSCGPPLDVEPVKMRAADQAVHESGVHRAHDLAM
ncbi:MAG TPA: glutamyl-tRNA reductase [Streptosporangiaceae bacterium]|nr:glutamyl-tRNA reductase [Streptosporangiaceae bacterium]